MCLQAEWESGKLQVMECLATARTHAFSVEPRTVKMQLTLVFMSQKGWVDARRSLPGLTAMVIIVEFFGEKRMGVEKSCGKRLIFVFECEISKDCEN